MLITNGNGLLDPDGIDGIVSKIKEESIELVVLCVPISPSPFLVESPLTLRSGVDFDDEEYGFKEEDKDPSKVIRPCC